MTARLTTVTAPASLTAIGETERPKIKPTTPAEQRALAPLRREQAVERINTVLKAAAPPLTDWIPCTTPPVREGVYELCIAGTDGTPGRANWRDGVWYWRGTDNRASGPNNPAHSMHWKWRGVRRWVLTEAKYAFAGLGPASLFVKKRSAKTTHWTTLAHAISFATHTEAENYRDARRHGLSTNGIVAVLP